jgi:hypothetical protein
MTQPPIDNFSGTEFNNKALGSRLLWSWGGGHSSLGGYHRILQEMRWILRPGGKATVMVYHRSWWTYYFSALMHGVFRGQFKLYRERRRVSQAATDGGIARYYRADEWGRLTRDSFEIDAIRIAGLKAEILPLPSGKPKRMAEGAIPAALVAQISRAE